MEGTVILKCDCQSEFQDRTYGKGMRVHNRSGKNNRIAYCTVCTPSNNNKFLKEQLAKDGRVWGMTTDQLSRGIRRAKPC